MNNRKQTFNRNNIFPQVKKIFSFSVKILIYTVITLYWIILNLTVLILIFSAVYFLFFSAIPFFLNFLVSLFPVNNFYLGVISGFKDFDLSFDFGQFLVFVAAVIAAYLGWLRYITSRTTEQFSQLSKMASSGNEAERANAISTLPVFSKKRKPKLYEKYIPLSHLHDLYRLIYNFLFWPFKKYSKSKRVINPRFMEFCNKYLPNVSDYFYFQDNSEEFFSSNYDELEIEEEREKFIREYNVKYPYIGESLNIIRNNLVIQAEKRKQKILPKEGFTLVETSASEALTKINNNTMKKLKINNKCRLISALDLSDKGFNEIKINKADLRGAKFNKTDFSYSELSEIDLSSSNLSRTDFTGTLVSLSSIEFAVLKGTKFNSSRLNIVNLDNTILENVFISRTKMNESSFIKANLIFTDISNSDLRKSNLKHTSLKQCKLINTNLKMSNLQDICLEDMTLENVRFDYSFMDEDTYNKYYQKYFFYYNLENLKEILTFNELEEEVSSELKALLSKFSYDPSGENAFVLVRKV